MHGAHAFNPSTGSRGSQISLLQREPYRKTVSQRRGMGYTGCTQNPNFLNTLAGEACGWYSALQFLSDVPKTLGLIPAQGKIGEGNEEEKKEG